ncbi:MAG: carboxypeptidase regulatory-like domain-containing protein [Verrucomicrobiales bacterium]|nr:carboxypeptidase regulatory-like domain-containing protein [Verrucomicrobiales bacterium]
MKRILFALICSLAIMNTHGASRDADWKAVTEAAEKGLPRTAVERLQPIIDQCLAEKAWAEAVKAIALRLTYEGQVEGNKPEEKITRMADEISKAPPEIVPILTAVQAHWYWQYFQQNRWRFMRRTATAEAPGNDFTTWDLKRLFAEIDLRFTEALAARDQLRTIPIEGYDALLIQGALPDRYRPTLYDFIAQEALGFYTSGEQAGARPEDAFEINAADPIFAPVPEFLTWEPATTETNAPALKAIRLYQEVLRFHHDDADKSALLDADLARLVWGSNVAFGEDTNGRYEVALGRFADEHADHEIASMALYKLALSVSGRDEPAEAHAIAERGRTIHPDSPGGRSCANLIATIEAPMANIQTERVWNAPWPDIRVTYKNTTKVWFRAVRWDWEEMAAGRLRPISSVGGPDFEALLKRKPDLEWSRDLPPTADYRERHEDSPAPATLEPGQYAIIASHNAAFSNDDNQLSLTEVWVSKLAFISRVGSGQCDGFVLDAETGNPLPGAKVEAWTANRDNRQWRLTRVKTVETDANGRFEFSRTQQGEYWFRARYGAYSIGSAGGTWWNQRAAHESEDLRTIFFTDRAIYRPGQIVRYKGICLALVPGRDDYGVLSDERVEVTFFDRNNKEIAKQTHQANSYGSFSGSFTAPTDRVLGRMRLSVTNGRTHGDAWVQVEEYKRPKFQVTVEAPETAPKLNEQVTVTGEAMGYTGVPVDGAQVQWRVTREVRMPWWWWGFGRGGGGAGGSSAEIAHGTARTGVDGRFEIGFLAKPDRSVLESDQPTFAYRVHADVTDTAGETRSDERTVLVGYVALEARLIADDWLTAAKPVELKVRTTTLDGGPQVAEGVVRVHRLKAPERVQRASLFRDRSDASDLSDPSEWPLGDAVKELGFTTDPEGNATLAASLPVGVYRAVIETQDRFGKPLKGQLNLRVIDPDAKRLAIKVPHLLAAPTWSVEPGETFSAVWGTGYDQGRAFVEILHRDRTLESYWTPATDTQARIWHRAVESERGGFTVRLTFVHENRAYTESRDVSVPWTNKMLELSWEHFTSKLKPGQEETWTLVVSGKDATKRVAEMVATLYDASLDAFQPHRWFDFGGFFPKWGSWVQDHFSNEAQGFQARVNGWRLPKWVAVDLTYRHFPPELEIAGEMDVLMMRRYGLVRGRAMPMTAVADNAVMFAAAPAPAESMALGVTLEKSAGVTRMSQAAPGGLGGAGEIAGEAPGPDLSKVAARSNLSETAFFFPHLTSDQDGVVRMTFTMPEALTEWHFLGFAHDRELRSGLIEGTTVTAKDLMVQPNPPRFLREGDEVEFTVKVSNQADKPQTGRIALNFRHAISDAPVDNLLANTQPEQDFAVPAKESRTYSWRLKVPDGLPALVYRTVAASANLSDGEEGMFPVVARRVLVTESLPLPLRGPATKQFSFDRLLRSGSSDTLTQQSLTLQMVSNPAWYAVLALPYLMEYPHECTEQTFNRLYANVLARFIASGDPKIRRIFDQWKNTRALDSPLEKNPELKSALLEESPWWRQAQDESQARRNVGILFDDNRLNDETARTLQKLREAQYADGVWSWFPGGPRNDYMTLYIVTGFGRLRHLGADIDMSLATKALASLDEWLKETYERIRYDKHLDRNNLSPRIALQLYGRSFFLKDLPVAEPHREALDYFLGQARQYWVELGNRQSQGHLALALLRFGDKETPSAIVKSLKERSVTDDEMGRFWRDSELSWWWFRAPIETQALMIEVFAEVAGDKEAVDECQTWLLKQKQTQDWKTTKATADAVYALLLQGRNVLAGDKLVEVSLGGMDVTPGSSPAVGSTSAVEPGTGMYEVRFAGSEVKPDFGQITVKKLDEGVAWGGLHWQYFEEVSKVTPYEGTPLKLNLRLFTKHNTPNGPELREVRGPVAVGDELVTRLELRVDRDMEYVHLKLPRGSGTEPVNVLSRYRFQDGLGYYESTRDTATHCFIDYLPKGTYVFETSVRVQLRGGYETGFASIQSMYAPEFNSHSQSLKLDVR